MEDQINDLILQFELQNIETREVLTKKILDLFNTENKTYLCPVCQVNENAAREPEYEKLLRERKEAKGRYFELDKQIKEIDKHLGSISDGGIGNYNSVLKSNKK